MRVGILVILFFCILNWAPVVTAESPAVILRGMSAVPAAGSEWIALENTNGATISAQVWSVRDVQGSIKTWSVPALQPYELKMFSGVETKISLNNTGDQVELLQNGLVVQSSAPYEELLSGSIWLLLSDGWREVTIEDWEQRWPLREWRVVAVSPSPTPSPLQVVTPRPTPKPVVSPQSSPVDLPRLASPSPMSSSAVKTQLKSDIWKDVAFPHSGAVSSVSTGLTSPSPIWEREPGDFSMESERFRSWKRSIWLRLAFVFSFSVFTMTLCAPRLYRCYNEACLLDDGLPL